MEDNVSQVNIPLGGGAQFWAYISSQNHTDQVVTRWRIHLEHTTSDWMGDITSDNPQTLLKTPGLFGVFNVTVTAAGPHLPEGKVKLLEDDPPCYYRPDIACSPDNAGMIGIVATADGAQARYWTVSDAF